MLHEMGRHRQIVVSTHDPRLQKAFTDQELPVTVFQVTRGEGASVKVACIEDPVALAIGDARAIAATRGLPSGTYSHVLPGLCRIALENAFLEAAWTRHHRTGGSEHDLQIAIDSAERFQEVAAFALFGDASRSSDVKEELRRRYGSPACSLIQQCAEDPQAGGDRMITASPVSVEGLLLTADRLLGGELAEDTTAGRYRGACLALRTALEIRVSRVLEAATPGLSRTTGRAKLLLLHSVVPAETARRAKDLWSQLSLGCHYHLYELGPTYDQVRAWRTEIDDLVRELIH
ncbi:hypothetical protein [Streptomyces fungicidicus]|nr:hypothetical protein [Streptomyces fungicidicus]